VVWSFVSVSKKRGMHAIVGSWQPERGKLGWLSMRASHAGGGAGKEQHQRLS
jgi:hypothetical protein